MASFAGRNLTLTKKVGGQGGVWNGGGKKMGGVKGEGGAWVAVGSQPEKKPVSGASNPYGPPLNGGGKGQHG